MSPLNAALGGAIIMSAIWFVLISNVVAHWRLENTVLKKEIFRLKEMVIHLEGIVHPQHWIDASDVTVKIATKERIYDKYPDLVRPGSEVIKIEDSDE
jgi:hypothetical protein